MTYAERQAQLARLREQLGNAVRYPGPGSAAAQLQALTSMLNVIGQLALLAPTESLRAAWMAEYRELQPQAAELRAALTENPPGAFLRTLDAVSDRALRFADAVLGGVEGVAAGAGGLARVLPLIVIAILIVLAIGFFKGTLRARV